MVQPIAVSDLKARWPNRRCGKPVSLKSTSIRKTCLGSFERHTREIRVDAIATTLGTDIFFWPRHSAVGVRDSARRGDAPRRGAASAAASRGLQSGCPSG